MSSQWQTVGDFSPRLDARPSCGARCRARGPPLLLTPLVCDFSIRNEQKHFFSYTGPSKKVRRTPTNEPRTKQQLMESITGLASRVQICVPD
jgi:hypothetical protein